MKLRARRAEDKQERRGSILEVAREAFRKSSFAEVKMSEVAERSGLAKGTVFLYFPTKEALFLALLEEELGLWFGALDKELTRGEAPWTARHAAKVVTTTVLARDELTRLLMLLHVVLEQNVDRALALSFKTMLRERTLQTGKHLEARLPFLSPGEGKRFLLILNALAIGLRQMAEPGEVVKELLELPEMAPLRADFATEFENAVENLLTGLEHRPQRKS